MKDEQKQDAEDFEAWWNNEGSEKAFDIIQYSQSESLDFINIKKLLKDAWLNGAFKADMRAEERALEQYNETQKKYGWDLTKSVYYNPSITEDEQTWQ